MSKFTLSNPPKTVAGEVERVLRALMWNHDNQRGIGGYYLRREDVERLHGLLGDDAESTLHGAGFRPHDRHRHQMTTGPRSQGDEAKIPLKIKWETLEAVVNYWRTTCLNPN
jgi:hypothetical protein